MSCFGKKEKHVVVVVICDGGGGGDDLCRVKISKSCDCLSDLVLNVKSMTDFLNKSFWSFSLNNSNGILRLKFCTKL